MDLAHVRAASVHDDQWQCGADRARRGLDLPGAGRQAGGNRIAGHSGRGRCDRFGGDVTSQLRTYGLGWQIARRRAGSAPVLLKFHWPGNREPHIELGFSTLDAAQALVPRIFAADPKIIRVEAACATRGSQEGPLRKTTDEFLRSIDGELLHVDRVAGTVDGRRSYLVHLWSNGLVGAFVELDRVVAERRVHRLLRGLGIGGAADVIDTAHIPMENPCGDVAVSDFRVGLDGQVKSFVRPAERLAEWATKASAARQHPRSFAGRPAAPAVLAH